MSVDQSSNRLGPELRRFAPPGAPSLLKRSDPSSSLRFTPAVTFRIGAFLELFPMADWKKMGGDRLRPESGLTGGARSPKLDAMLEAEDEIGVTSVLVSTLGAKRSSYVSVRLKRSAIGVEYTRDRALTVPGWGRVSSSVSVALTIGDFGRIETADMLERPESLVAGDEAKTATGPEILRPEVLVRGTASELREPADDERVTPKSLWLRRTEDDEKRAAPRRLPKLGFFETRGAGRLDTDGAGGARGSMVGKGASSN